MTELTNENEQLRQQLDCTIDILEQTRKDLAASNKRQDELQAERDRVVFAEALQDEIAKGHAEENELLKKQLAETQKDAQRYNWLRNTLHGAKCGGGIEVNEELQMYETPEDGKEVQICWYPSSPVGSCNVYASTMDEAIDAAMASQGDKP